MILELEMYLLYDVWIFLFPLPTARDGLHFVSGLVSARLYLHLISLSPKNLHFSYF